jgi:hypothetical protein
MDGFLSQGPCPLGDLGGWSRGPYLCPDLPGHIVTAMVRQYAPAHRARRRIRTCRRASRGTRISRLICGRASSAGSGSREPAWPACRTLAHWYGVNRDTLADRRPGRPADRQLGGNSAKMNTLKCGRSSTTGLSPPVNSRFRPPARRSISTIWPAVQVPGERQRKQVADQASTPIVWSWVIWRS